MGGSETDSQYSDSRTGTRTRSRGRAFRPGVAATLFTAFFLPVLLSLGAWQLDRAAQKRALFADFAAGAGEAVELAAHPGGLDDLPRYARVEARGRFLGEHQFLLDNMVDGGRAGYRVLTPLVLGDGRAVIVDRGWVPKSFGARAALPEVAVGDRPRSVTGRLDRLPRPGIALAGDSAGPSGWPRVVQFPSSDELSGALGLPLVNGVVLLDADAPDGFVRNWRPSDFGPERHLGYAVQWFALAGTLVIAYLAWAFRRSD